MKSSSNLRLMLAALGATVIDADNTTMQIKAKTKLSETINLPHTSRGKSGKTPRTFSGVARARREAKKLRNSK